MIPEDTTLGEGSVGLANDIELHAERIRRERSKRRQQQLTAPVTAELPLVGNLIGEDHVNYVLMYNMLTGIRIGVRFTLTMVNMV
jgi:1-phosphatidylinositol-4-phosphate 5-kinase